MVLRDFTDEARAEFEDAASATYVGGSDRWTARLGDALGDFFGGFDLAGIDGYYGRIADANDLSKRQVGALFTRVYADESGFVGRLGGVSSRLDGLLSSVKALDGLVDPSAGDGCGWGWDPVVFGVRLVGVGGVEYGRVVGEVVLSYDAHGCPQFDWSAVDGILSRGSGDISQVEYFVLAQLFTGQLGVVGDEGMTRFLQALADKQKDEDGYTTWAYDMKKIDGLQVYVDGFADSITLQELALGQMDDQAIRAMYEGQFPEGDMGLDVDGMYAALYENLNVEGKKFIQDSALLDTVGGLSAAGDFDLPFLSVDDSDPLTGVSGASGPDVTLKGDGDGGYSLTFKDTKETWGTAAAIGNPYASPSYMVDHFNENTLTISNALSGSEVGTAVKDDTDKYYTGKYSVSLNDIVTSNVTSAAVGEMESKLVSSIGSKTVSGALGYLSAGVGVDILEDQEEQRQNLAEWNAASDAWSRENYCAELQLTGVVVGDGGSGATIVMKPSDKTLTMLAELNETFVDNGLSLSTYDFPVGHADVLSMGDVLDDPEDVQKIFEDHTTLLKDGATLDDAIARIQRTGR